MSALYNRTGETMKIQTEVRRIDVLRAIVAVHIGTRQNYIAFLMIAAVILWLNLYNDDFDNSFSWWFSYSILSLGFTLIGFLFSMLITIPFVLFSSSYYRGVVGWHEYEICKDGFLEKTNINQDKIMWKGINDVRITRSSILMIKNKYFFYLIPKHGFSSEREFEKFADTARTSWTAARHQPAV